MSDRSRHERLQRLFAGACELARSERSAWLAERCGGDDALRREVEQLLLLDEQPPLYQQDTVERMKVTPDEESPGDTRDPFERP